MSRYLKLSSFYFFYFALLGGVVPYLSLYLHDQGFSLIEVSWLSAVFMLTKVIAPNIWGWLGDKTHERLKLVRWGAFLTLLSIIGLAAAQGFWFYAFILATYSFFWNAVLPQFEVLTLHNLGGQRDRYSQVRLWGSLGFISAVILLGYVFEFFGIQLFPSMLAIIVSLIWLSSLWNFSEPAFPSELSSGKSFLKLLGSRRVIVFLTIYFLLQLSHGPYYTYFSLYLSTMAIDKGTIGWLWSLGVFAEVVLFLVMHRWFALSSLKFIMASSLLVTSIRWYLIAAFPEQIFLLVLAQVGHAFSFGAMHAVAIKYVHLVFGDGLQGRGQAIYASLSFGLGGGVGALLSGPLVVTMGYSALYLVSCLVSVVALMLVLFLYTEPVEED